MPKMTEKMGTLLLKSGQKKTFSKNSLKPLKTISSENAPLKEEKSQ